MEIWNPFPFYHGEGFGFLCPIFDSPIFEEKWYLNVWDYCKQRDSSLTDGYHVFLEQYPKYKRIVEKNLIKLFIGKEMIDLSKIVEKINKKKKYERMRTENYRENLSIWVQFVGEVCEKEGLSMPSEKVVTEILFQNNMNKHAKYLEKCMTEKVTKSDLCIISSLPFDFKTNRSIFFLSKYKGVPRKYSCRKERLAFREECPKIKPLSKKSFGKKVKELGFDEEITKKLLKNPEKFSLYELKYHSQSRK